MNLKQAKKYLPEYLDRIGVEIHRDGNRKKILCQNPFHAEKKPSAQINNTGIVNCYGCGARYDVFDLIGWNEGISGLGEQIKYFSNMFGTEIENTKNESEVEPVFRGWVERNDFVSVHMDKAKWIYRKSAVLPLLAKCVPDPVFDSAYPFMDKVHPSHVACVDFRVISGDSKQVITVWYDGKNLKLRNPPNLIWGMDHLDHGKPALIVEGAKCADIAHKLLGHMFSVHTWNRGTAGARYCNWSDMTGFKKIYLLADLDRKRDRNGLLIPPEKQVGLKCMLDIAKSIHEIDDKIKIKVCETSEKVLKIKSDGGDIEEMKVVMNVHDIVKYIVEDGKDFWG